MVSVARRNLFQEKTRLLISTGGVAFALLLVLALDGIVAGSTTRLTAYINSTGADAYVAQPGVRTMHMSASALPLSKVDEISRVEGVAEVRPILYASYPVAAGESRSFAYVIGFDSERERGGPWLMSEGSTKLDRGEVVLDSTAAGKLGVGIGDEVQVLGGSFRIRGISLESSNIANTMAFIRFDDFARLQGKPEAASYLLVWLADGVAPEEGARRINAAIEGVGALTRAEFAREEARVVRDMSAEIMLIMNAVGFLIGLAAVALTIYTATLAKIREYGVLKALGASNRWLYRMVMEQALLSVGIGAIASLALVLALSAIFAWLVPDIPLGIEAESVAKTFVGAALISLVAAAVPIRQVARLDPAAVFRR